MGGYLYASLLLLEKRKLNYISILTFYRIHQEGSRKNLLQVQARRKYTLLRRTKATNFANGRSINRADVDRVAFVATNGGELAILVAQKDVNVLTTLTGCVVEDGIAWLGRVAAVGRVPTTSGAIVCLEATHTRDTPTTIVRVDKWHTRLLVHPADKVRTPILPLALAIEYTRLWSVKLLVSSRDDLRSDG